MKSRNVLAITLVASLFVACTRGAREVDESICGPLPPSKMCNVRMCISGDPSWSYSPFPEGARCGSDGRCDSCGRCVEPPSRALPVAKWIERLPRFGRSPARPAIEALLPITNVQLAAPPHGGQ
jgi:hypothetical protein